VTQVASESARFKRSSTPNALAPDEVAAIEGRPVVAKHREDILPLMVGDLAAQPKPAQFLNDRVLGRADVEQVRGIVRHLHAPAAVHLSLFVREGPENEEIGLDGGVAVNQICARSLTHRPGERRRIDEEVVAERFDQGLNLCLRHPNDEVHVHGRAGLPDERARHRSADQIVDADGLQSASDFAGDFETVGVQASSASSSG